MQGDQEEENVILIEDVLAADVYVVGAGGQVEKFRFHAHELIEFKGR